MNSEPARGRRASSGEPVPRQRSRSDNSLFCGTLNRPARPVERRSGIRYTARFPYGARGLPDIKELGVYAIFEDGGKQYKVSAGDKLLVELKDLGEGQSDITFDKVLMVGDGADARIGTPWVAGATVKAKLLEQLKMPKVHGVKFRRRKGYMKRWGHRQNMLKIEIEKIEA